jgi:hypothetical protein
LFPRRRSGSSPRREKRKVDQLSRHSTHIACGHALVIASWIKPPNNILNVYPFLFWLPVVWDLNTSHNKVDSCIQKERGLEVLLCISFCLYFLGLRSIPRSASLFGPWLVWLSSWFLCHRVGRVWVYSQGIWIHRCT